MLGWGISAAMSSALLSLPSRIAPTRVCTRFASLLGFGGDVDIGGLMDQCLEHQVKDRASEDAARRLRLKHPLLARGMRSSEVWGNCVGALQADVSVVSLLSPLTSLPARLLFGNISFNNRARKAAQPPIPYLWLA